MSNVRFSLASPDDATGGDDELQGTLDALATHGLHLPPDTTQENLIERIILAGHAVRGAMGMGQGQAGGGEVQLSLADQADIRRRAAAVSRPSARR